MNLGSISGDASAQAPPQLSAGASAEIGRSGDRIPMEVIAGGIRRGAGYFAGLLLAAMVVRLILEPRYLVPVYFAVMAVLALYGLLQRRTLKEPTVRRVRWALLTNFLAINLGYVLVGVAMNARPGWRGDPWLYRLDCLICRGDPQRWFAAIRAPLPGTIGIVGYISFVGYLVYLFLAEAFPLSAAAGRLQSKLMLMYGVGFAGYILCPSAGPIFYHPWPVPPETTNGFTAFFNAWVIRCCSQVDVWPSLHAAVAMLTVVWTWGRHPRAFAVLLPLTIILIFGALYFQYHYVTDILSGLALCAFIAWPRALDRPAAGRHPPRPAA